MANSTDNSTATTDEQDTSISSISHNHVIPQPHSIRQHQNTHTQIKHKTSSTSSSNEPSYAQVSRKRPPNYHETTTTCHKLPSPIHPKQTMRSPTNTLTKSAHHQLLHNNNNNNNTYKKFTNSQHGVKLINGGDHHAMNRAAIAQEAAASRQRTLVWLFKLYFLVVVILALAYLVYCAYQFTFKTQHHQLDNIHHNKQQTDYLQSAQLSSGDHLKWQSELESNSNRQNQLEQRLQLMQKYIELIAVDLQDTKDRLREREKCHCSRTCTFNMTQYADGSSWKNDCDNCTCQSGKVTCAPIKCPKPNCDEPQNIPSQCCPVCLKRCKYNQMTLRHGQTFKPHETPGKECKCFDGLIKCAHQTNQAHHQNKTQSSVTIQTPKHLTIKTISGLKDQKTTTSLP